MSELRREYPRNLIDGSTVPNIQVKVDDQVVNFIPVPGADVGPAQGSFRYAGGDVKTGCYECTDDRSRFLFNLGDIVKAAEGVENPILLSHVPPRFNGEDSMDYFGLFEAQEAFVFPDGTVIDEGTTFSSKGRELVAEGYPVAMVGRNRGNAHLRQAIEQAGIKKGIHGHVHETAGVMQSLDSRLLDPDCYHDEAFVNASCYEQGKVGLYTVEEDGKVAYEMIDL
jgi:hypothetical protein